MTDYTKTQLATAVLRQMRVTDAYADPDANDLDLVRQVYTRKREEWDDRDLVYWTDSGSDTAEIPGPIYQTLIDLVENEVAPHFGRGGSLEDKHAREELLLKRLRRHVARPPTGLPIAVDTY